MSETQTTIQRFEEKTRKTLERTKEGIQNLLDKMRGTKLGLDPQEVAKKANEEE